MFVCATHSHERSSTRTPVRTHEGLIKLFKTEDESPHIEMMKLVVVDEAHHIHARGELENLVEKYANAESATRLLLMSDVSQGAKIEMGTVCQAVEIRWTAETD